MTATTGDAATAPEDDVDREIDDPAHDDDPRTGRLGRLSVVAGAAVLIAAAGASVLLATREWQHRQVDTAANEAQATASAYAETLTSIDSSQVDENFTRILDGATGEFKDMYTQSSVQLRQLLIDNKATARGTVVDSAIKSKSTDQVEVLLFVDQSVSNSASPAPRLDRSRIRMTMKKIDGRWLASKVELP